MVYKKIKKIADENGVRIKKISDNYVVGSHVVEIIDGRVIRVNGKIVRFNELKRQCFKKL
ncbi:hypothetical protein B0P06_003894 [Clostridium saccharoperbutylacetonicum]|uniref:hypothetical protein n=1 Tax=Clostridium saccharoperbutylacetonicum TaxID=36745 RepID=UPI000346BDD3|nr:hypothetical protein [Clostridium saccharoperbutylacetonicum]NRT61431.1 hypothetical protein [Clostridium saccharoperbutylacetonicum]NSB24750.1 hypothetical protein [Clostridium saccharoperbutylacetonicum]NSB44123.1 hypothetical protein [Clostridium saccharoperbutylacetonicum]